MLEQHTRKCLQVCLGPTSNVQDSASKNQTLRRIRIAKADLYRVNGGLLYSALQDLLTVVPWRNPQLLLEQSAQ